jgi:hypothetical protein
VLVLHEVAEGAVEIEQLLEVAAEGLVFFVEFVEFLNAFVDLALHQEDNSLREELELLYFGGGHLKEGGAVYVIIGAVEVSVFDLGLRDLD